MSKGGGGGMVMAERILFSLARDFRICLLNLLRGLGLVNDITAPVWVPLMFFSFDNAKRWLDSRGKSQGPPKTKQTHHHEVPVSLTHGRRREAAAGKAVGCPDRRHLFHNSPNLHEEKLRSPEAAVSPRCPPSIRSPLPCVPKD